MEAEQGGPFRNPREPLWEQLSQEGPWPALRACPEAPGPTGLTDEGRPTTEAEEMRPGRLGSRSGGGWNKAPQNKGRGVNAGGIKMRT